jgi:hypothetical protein
MAHRRLGILSAIGILAIAAVVPQLLAAAPSETAEVPSPDVLIRVVRPQAEPSPSAARRVRGSSAVSPTAPGSTGSVRINANNSSEHANADGGDTEIDVTGQSSTGAHNIEVLMERTTTARPAAGADGTPCPKATTCERYQLRRARLPSTSSGRVDIPYSFNDEGRRNLRAPAGLLESAFRSAAQEWRSWNSNLNFVHQGTTTDKFAADGPDGGCDDGTNVVTWHRFDPSVIAAVSVCTDDSGRVVRDVDLAMNVTQHWENVSGEPDSRHSFDIRSIVAHELGHWLSFADIYGAADSKQTMFGRADHGETGKRTLALGDIVGVQTAYPCGAGDSCPRTGIKND